MAEYTTVGVGDLSYLVRKTGLSDPALRLVIGLLSAYPLALFYRKFLYKTNTTLQHVYFTLTGMSMITFCFGWGVIHSIINTILVYLILVIAGPTLTSVISIFILNLGYLLGGIMFYATTEYDINWTTPHCLLCLRLISVAWDYYDGAQNQETLSADFKQTALSKLPSILEVFGCMYFMGGCLVGPLFPIKPYLRLVHGELIDREFDNNSCIPAGLKRLSGGVIYLGLYTGLGMWFTAGYMQTDEFKDLSFLVQILYVGFWGRILLMRYLGVWLISEGSCIITGLSYSGKTEDGKLTWDGLRNVKLSIYELSYTFQHMVESFNLNTNKWVFRYFFKRLRFLGNKNLSHFLTLMFLAVWHGFHAGYFICFCMEFLIIMMERQIFDLFAGIFKMRWADMGPWLKSLAIGIMWPIRFLGFGYCIIPFHFLTWSAMKEPLHTTYYLVPLVLVVWFPIYLLFIHPIFKAFTKKPTDPLPDQPLLQPTEQPTSDKERLKKIE